MVSDRLSAFLADAASRKVDLGQWDCGLWLADWYMVATGKSDPADDLRGRGLESPLTIRDTINRLGLAHTSEPQRGDVGLVSLHKGHLVGAIFTGSHWCMLTDGGIGALLPKRFRFIAAWRIA